MRKQGMEHQRGFTLIEMVIVMVILSVVSAIAIKFLVDGVRIYAMAANQKVLYDEGKFTLERMVRDIRDAASISSPASGGPPAGAITFVRTNATAQDGAGETITFRRNESANLLEKVKAGVGYPMAGNVTEFTVMNVANEIQIKLTLQLTSGENVTLQTKIYPKNLPISSTYKNFRGFWQEGPSS